MLELKNQILDLNKGIMMLDEYTNAFTSKIELSPWLVPDELTKIDLYAKGFPWEYTVPVKQAPTFEAII